MTEFLPVSSSGHLAMFENIPFFTSYSAELQKSVSLLGFNVILHLGTLLAVLVYYRKDIWNIALMSLRDLSQKNFKGEGIRIVFLLFFATLPVLTVPFYIDFVDQVTNSLTYVAIFFIFNGLLLSLTDFFVIRKKKHHEHLTNIHEMSFWQAMVIGFFQLLSVFPGISRSGSTISGGFIISSMKGEEAVRFSFFMSIPVLLGAILVEGKDYFEQSVSTAGHQSILLLLLGMVASFAAGMASLRMLIWLGKKLLFYPFGFYTILLGITLLIFFV